MNTAAPPLPAGTVHETIPADLRETLTRDAKARATWMDITPLARKRLERTRSQLSRGQRRPCCWEGCPHREKTGK
jgi:hypothetical protein